MCSNPTFILYPFVCIFIVKTSFKFLFVREIEKFGWQLKYIVPLHKIVSTSSNNEFRNCRCLQSLKVSKIEVFIPWGFKGWSAIFTNPIYKYLWSLFIILDSNLRSLVSANLSLVGIVLFTILIASIVFGSNLPLC